MPAAANDAKTESADGLRLAAHHPLQARQTYQIVQHRQDDRWLLYLGHLRGSERNPLTGRAERPRDGKLRTHKNFWDCETGEVYLVTSVAGWTGQILQVFNVVDPDVPLRTVHRDLARDRRGIRCSVHREAPAEAADGPFYECPGSCSYCPDRRRGPTVEYRIEASTPVPTAGCIAGSTKIPPEGSSPFAAAAQCLCTFSCSQIFISD
jgi:hypothetical protein